MLLRWSETFSFFWSQMEPCCLPARALHQASSVLFCLHNSLSTSYFPSVYILVKSSFSLESFCVAEAMLCFYGFTSLFRAPNIWCWRRLLRVPWTKRRSNQSILKKISPECSLEGLMLKLKLQYFGHLMWRIDLLEKTLMLGRIGGRRRRGQQRMRWWMASLTRWAWVWVDSVSWWWTGLACCDSWGRKESDTEWLNWTEHIIRPHASRRNHSLHSYGWEVSRREMPPVVRGS